MLVNLHDLSEPSRHRDICASSSRQEATASPSPTQLTEHLTASCGNPASLGDVFSSALPQFILVIIFPVQFSFAHFLWFFLMLCISELPSCCFIIPTWRPPPQPVFEAFFPFQKGFPQIYLSWIRSLCTSRTLAVIQNIATPLCSVHKELYVCTSVYVYACLRVC